MGRYTLHLGESEFWHLTFRQFMALLREHKRSEQASDFRAGIVAAGIRNAQRAKESDYYFEPWDFFPSLKPKDGALAAAGGFEPDENGMYTDDQVDRFWSKTVGIFQSFGKARPREEAISA